MRTSEPEVGRGPRFGIQSSGLWAMTLNFLLHRGGVLLNYINRRVSGNDCYARSGGGVSTMGNEEALWFWWSPKHDLKPGKMAKPVLLQHASSAMGIGRKSTVLKFCLVPGDSLWFVLVMHRRAEFGQRKYWVTIQPFFMLPTYTFVTMWLQIMCLFNQTAAGNPLYFPFQNKRSLLGQPLTSFFLKKSFSEKKCIVTSSPSPALRT